MFGAVTVNASDLRVLPHIRFEKLWAYLSTSVARIIVDSRHEAVFAPRLHLGIYDYAVIGPKGADTLQAIRRDINGETAYEIGDNALLISFDCEEDSAFFKLKFSDVIALSDRNFKYETSTFSLI